MGCDVLPGNIGQEGLVAIRFAIQHEASLAPLHGVAEALGAKEQPKLGCVEVGANLRLSTYASHQPDSAGASRRADIIRGRKRKNPAINAQSTP